MGKQRKAPVSEKTEMTPVFMEKICTREVGISTWEGMYNLLEEENPSHGGYNYGRCTRVI